MRNALHSLDAAWFWDLGLVPAVLFGAGLLVARKARPALGHTWLSAASAAALAYLPIASCARTFDWGFFGSAVSAQAQTIPLELWGLAPAQASRASISPTTLLAALWLLCSAWLVLRLRSSYYQGVQQLAQAERELKPQEPVAQLVRQLCSQLGLAQPRLLISSQLRSPLAWGLGQPRLLLPESFLQLDPGALRGVLTHELSHLQRRDAWTALIARVACVALPFHPLAWIARREQERLAELACDERVLDLGCDAPRYAEALLRLIPRTPAGLASGLLGRGGLEQRIIRILADPPTRTWVGRWARCAIFLLTLGLAGSLALARSRSPQLQLPVAHKLSSAPAEALDLANFVGGEVRVYPAHLDLGTAPAQTEQRGSLWIVNHGSQPRRILKAKPTCGCLTLSEIADLELGPGEAVELPLTMLATAAPGERAEKRILVRIEDQPVLEARVSLATTP